MTRFVYLKISSRKRIRISPTGDFVRNLTIKKNETLVLNFLWECSSKLQIISSSDMLHSLSNGEIMLKSYWNAALGSELNFSLVHSIAGPLPLREWCEFLLLLPNKHLDSSTDRPAMSDSWDLKRKCDALKKQRSYYYTVMRKVKRKPLGCKMVIKEGLNS